ncbi:uncharacterized protein PAC_11707 [Phialocephala subalpina]|uniref:Uncharacterized protein n=1 Tax=Phialocephala subalpina TaxID=576137 RepID=A0A1L7X9V9_9HELO|nr:uncharacterized protein PAC_11707 [Phialocephala subalpina]
MVTKTDATSEAAAIPAKVNQVPYLSFRPQVVNLPLLSIFFKAAFNGPYLESQSRSITFDDIEGDTCALLIDWSTLRKSRRNMLLPATCSSVLIDINDLYKTKAIANFTKYVYENASAGSVLRSFCALDGLAACRKLELDRPGGWKQDWIDFLRAAFVPDAAIDFLKISFKEGSDLYKTSPRRLRSECLNLSVPE